MELCCTRNREVVNPVRAKQRRGAAHFAVREQRPAVRDVVLPPIVVVLGRRVGVAPNLPPESHLREVCED